MGSKIKTPEPSKDTENAQVKEGVTGFEVIDSYKGVEILRTPEEICPIYKVIMPEFTKRDWEKMKRLKDDIMQESTLDPTTIPDPKIRKQKFTIEAKRIIKAHDPSISQEKLDIYTDILVKGMIGYGLLDPLLADDNLEEVMVIGERKNVYVAHRKHGMCSSNIVFEEDMEIINIIDKMARDVGRRIDQLNPLLDARLKDGSRVNATVRPITPGGATLTIRKFKADPLTVIDLIKFKTLSVDFCAWLWFCIDGLGIKPANAVVAGGTGSGKTTTLNCLAAFIPEGDRVITIEDTMELQLDPHKHWIQMETRPANVEGQGEVDMNDCLTNTLRMRPDRIVLGEVRGKEAATLFTAMNTGHDGCMGTLHANDAKETITRLTNAPMNVPMIMIPALDIIIMQNKFKHPTRGTLRRITEVAEIAGMEQDRVLLNRIFKYNPNTDQIEETGTPSQLVRTIGKKGALGSKEINMHITKRALVLKWLVDNNKRRLGELKSSVQDFNRDPDGFVDKIMEGM